MVTAIIAAAGQGKRMGRGINKVFIPLCSYPILLHSIKAILSCNEVSHVVVVAASHEIHIVSEMLAKANLSKHVQVVAGGKERQDSIFNALAVIDDAVEFVAVHDGARPLITADLITNVIEAAKIYKAAVLAVPVKDTIKIAENGFVSRNLDRSCLWAMQTPQVFETGLLKMAYKKAKEENYLGTDDAALVEHLGVKSFIVDGSYQNIKITTQEDLLFAETIVGRVSLENRDGI